MTFNPQPKPQKRKKGRRKVSQAETEYMLAVKKLPCVISGIYGVIAHHACHDRKGRGKWNGWSCIPLHPRLHDRHTPKGIHENKGTWEERHGPDWSYIPQTLQAIYGDQWNIDH